MKEPIIYICTFSIFMITCLSSFQTKATLLDDIGHTALSSTLGGSTPNGSGVSVSLVEAFTSPPSPAASCSNTSLSSCQYLPDSAIKTYTDRSSGLGFSTGFSDHSTGSANGFYGSGSSSSGVSNIDVYAADHWLELGYLNSGTSNAPLTSSTRVSTHSYVGSAGSQNLEVLQRIDYLADKDDHVLAVALNNGSTNQPLNSTAYNVISVGRTDANHPLATVDVNPSTGAYNATNRSGPDLVVPVSTTSGATPRVASAAALLVGYAQDQELVKSSGSITNRNADVIYHAETSEVIKASLMAGASRQTSNTSSAADLTDYRSASHQTSNGLDSRYGAGQLNINNSFNILNAGEQEAGTVGDTGFDYDNSFGGLNGSNSSAVYEFENSGLASFAASLVWNVTFDIDENEDFSDSVAELFNLDLALSVFNGSEFETLASSMSLVDNTENIWHELIAGTYRLEVSANGSFDHDYALAWNTSPVPLPASIWLFFTACSGLFITRRRKA